MASVRPVPIQWVPEDDLLLKNAVEAGASLEALAKGAVRFSRKFTLRELQDRWYSLLYDPDISAQASIGIFELEISGLNSSSKLNRPDNSFTGNKEVPRRRKSESIRKKYYATRKKFRSELLNNTDVGLLESNPHDFSGHGADFQQEARLGSSPLGQNMVGHSISDHLGLQEEDLDILRHVFPETIRDIGMASGTTNSAQAGCQDNRQKGIMESYVFNENGHSSFAEGGNNVLEVNIKNRKIPITHCSVKELPQSSSAVFDGRQLFTPPNSVGPASLETILFESDQPHMRHWKTSQDLSSFNDMFPDTAQLPDNMLPDDVEGKRNDSSAVSACEFADPDSLLNLSNDDEILLTDMDEKHAENKSSPDNNINSVLQFPHIDGQENDPTEVQLRTVLVSDEVAAPSVHGSQQMDPHLEVNVSCKSTSNPDFAEFSGDKICCTLNTEDTEIPCNDDIFLLIHPSTSFGSSTQPNSIVSIESSGVAHEKVIDHVLNLSTKVKDSTKTFIWPPKVGIHSLPELHSTKTEAHDSRSRVPPGSAIKTSGDSSKGRSLTAIQTVSNDRMVQKEVPGVSAKVDDGPATATVTRQFAEAGSGKLVLQDSVVESSGSDDEESQIDDDVPYFSDVEATILDMDLDPYDQDSHVSRQVSSYQFDDSKRTIIRLEEATRSCLHRAMTSHGALAILYGRHLRHYIRKPEVLLGRSTHEIEVDIDLGKEGRANEISRRQVLLGRSTHDIEVDIDPGKEGRVNEISRRQAIIMMEADGSFFLKNLGKSSVTVNGMTVATGQLLNLSSSCLIEIKGMSFVFEINQGYVRKHLGNFILKDKGKTGWSTKDEP